jgi:hypothetical protein
MKSLANATAILAAVAAVGLLAAPASGARKVDTTKAFKKTGWGDNVRVTFDKEARTIRYRSDGLPNHELLPEYAVPNPGVVVPDETNSHIESAEDAIKKVPYDFTLTTRPRKADEKTVIKTGPVGLMISGAMTYNPYEGDGETVAAASNFTLTNADGDEVPFVDPCFGHPAPRPLSAYHYHALSKCVTRQVDRKNKPSRITGIAFDGFPIYGNRGMDGKKIDPADLDRCNGIKSPTPEFPDGIYHYVMLKVKTEQSSIRCLKGRVPEMLESHLELPRYLCPLRGGDGVKPGP